MEIPEKNKVPIDLIAKFLNGEADTNDIIDLEQWKAASGDNIKVFEEYKTIWEKTGQLSPFADIDIENEWNVFLESVESFEEENKTKRKSFTLFGNPVFRVAAALLAGLVLSYSSWFIFQSLKFEKLIAGNEVIQRSLPDGSQITLNKNSKLVYPRKFNENRNLRLEGEAFFEVVSDKANPFIVRSGDILVEVVGTSFNVSARRNTSLVQVVVETGTVAVYNEEFSPLKKDLVTAGEKISFSRESGIRSIQKNTDPNYGSWRTGRLIFNNSTLQYVINLLEQQYEVKIELINPLLSECRISVSFENEPIEFILQTITETLDLELIHSSEGYMINGKGC
jgi:ferric-dicitrate binding protein FerR (iron transport regulator)